MSSKSRHSSKNGSRPTPPVDYDQDEAAYDHDPMPEPSPEPKPMARQAAYEVDRIGDILRRVREHRGEDLEAISEYLRIRSAYLIALENSRYDELPADAYVIGFLRTYALYLGLDGKGAIDQYRREMAGRRRKPQLTMPQPMAEGRAPTITVLVGAALAALLVYAIWYGLSSPDSDAGKQATQAPPTTLTLSPANGGEATAGTENKGDTSLPSQTATSEGITLTVPASAVPPTVEAKETKTPEPAPTPAAPAATEEAKTEAVTANEPAPAKTETKTKEKDKDKDKDKNKEKDKKAEAQTPAPTAVEAKELPAPTPVAPPVEKEKEKEKEKTKSRLSIRAEKESWVLVTDSKGNTIFEKTLKPGETYSVPAGKGLNLTTGNASGVSFDLDGSTLPKLGSTDSVVRAVPLDPEKLKSRLNSGEAATPSE